MQNQAIEALCALGLSNKEAKIYSTLLTMGRGSAYAIAEKSKLKKPTTYVILGELIKKGFVFRIPRAKKQLFMAKDPEVVFANAEERLQHAKKALPELKAASDANNEKVKTFYFEGLKGIEESTLYRMKEMSGKEFLGFYATLDAHTPKEFIDFAYDWSEKMHKNGTTIRGIAPDDKSLDTYRAEDSKLGRYFKKIPVNEYSTVSSIDVGDTFIRILLNNEMKSVIIDNKNLADMLRQIFEMIWKRV